jgi:hypothetical protein
MSAFSLIVRAYQVHNYVLRLVGDKSPPKIDQVFLRVSSKFELIFQVTKNRASKHSLRARPRAVVLWRRRRSRRRLWSGRSVDAVAARWTLNVDLKMALCATSAFRTEIADRNHLATVGGSKAREASSFIAVRHHLRRRRQTVAERHFLTEWS